MPLLEIKDLKLGFGRGKEVLTALDGVSLSLETGQSLCLVGESGSGKSITALSIARLIPSPPAHYLGGEILVNGQDTLKMSETDLRTIRGGVVSYIFQEAGASLNPLIRIGALIMESLKLHRPEAATESEVIRLLKLVGIPAPESRIRNYPHELSGGMQQRVMIAIAIASEPQLLVADEPTTALDVTIQAQVIELLQELKVKLGMSILLITHNLGIVGDLADTVAVMYSGQIVETGPMHDLLKHPHHPYTQALMNSIPKLGNHTGSLTSIPGNVPPLGSWPGGCRFHPRCAKAQTDCQTEAPSLTPLESGGYVRCPYWKSELAGSFNQGEVAP
jgi:oligopeptide/dipeptide ABC transporter ATP-binding protein